MGTVFPAQERNCDSDAQVCCCSLEEMVCDAHGLLLCEFLAEWDAHFLGADTSLAGAAMRHCVGWQYVKPWWTTHAAADLHVEQKRSFPYIFSSSPNALARRPFAGDENWFLWEDECSSFDGQIYTEGWSCLLRIQAPHLSGSTWRHFCKIQLGRRYAGGFFPLHKQTCRAKPSQAADRRQCQKHKKKKKVFCAGLSCAVRRDVFSAQRLNKTACSFFFSLSSWQSSQYLVWCLEMNFLKLSIPKGMAEKVLFPIYDTENNGNTEIYRNTLAENGSQQFSL